MATMRSVPAQTDLGEREIASFADEVHRPLVIVGNGPSCAMPPYGRIPADAVFFRMNWFFLESTYHFGDRVDGWFSAVPNQTLEQFLHNEIRSRRYDVRRILSPMRHAAHRDGDTYGLEPLVDVEEFDSWSIPARSPRLARHFMSRPGLPTTGMQALAFGLGVGFREVYLAGIDLYESNEARYGFTVPEAAERGLVAKDLTPGYEAAHGLETDLAFLRSCLAEYPDATIRSLSQSDTLHLYVRQATDVRDRPHLSPAEGSAVGAPKDTVDLELPATSGVETLVIPHVEGCLWSEIEGRRCAYVTVVSGRYHHGVRALANSLRRVTDVPLVALCTPDVDKAALAASQILTIDVPAILNPITTRPIKQKVQTRFVATYTKLHVFRLDFLDRAVYLDADTVVRHNIDELFEGNHFAAVPDAGVALPTGQVFNSGVFAFRPSFSVFEDMMASLKTTPSYDGGDQGFLNEYMVEWQRLPLEYNTTKRIFSQHPANYHDDDVKVLHYVGKKPWEAHWEGRYDHLDYQWLSYLEGFEKDELIRDLRGAPGSATEPHSIGADSLDRVKLLLRAGEPVKAAELLESYGQSRPLSTMERRWLAMAYMGMGRRKDALKVFDKAESPVAMAAVGQGILTEFYRSRRRNG